MFNNPKNGLMSTKTNFLGWLILLGIGLTWGSSYFFIKKGLIHFSPLEVAALRMCITGILFLPWILKTFKSISFKDSPFLILVSLMGSGFPAVLFPMAQLQLSSGYTGILSASTPLFTLLLGSLFFKIRIPKFTMLGVIIGFVGIGILVSAAGSSYDSWNTQSAFLILAATCMYAVSTNTVNKSLTHLDSFSISCFVFTFLSIPGWAILGYHQTIPKIFMEDVFLFSFLPLLSLSFLGTFLATILFFQLIKREGVVFSSTVSYIIPCMALLLAFTDGEALHISQFVGMGIILLGIYLSRNKN
jgi:drug/metabolite transporter (DMT)-like permease